MPQLRTTLVRAVPAPLHPPLRRALRRYNLLRGPARGRRRALQTEVHFWAGWFDLPEADVARRLRPEIDDPVVLDCLARLGDGQARVLDVGAGPLSTLGTLAHGRQVHLTAVDPLADDYDALLARAGVTPLVRTQRCTGEELPANFAPGSFDLAFAENALDHAVDPLAVIRNMVAVVRPGGYVILNHAPDEGEHAGYGNVHQWNFRQEAGDCVLWRPGRRHQLSQVLDGVTLTCRTDRHRDRDRVVCVIERA